jgi:hypothetical protein
MRQKLHIDVGYDHDTQFALRRAVWNTGASYALPGFSVDAYATREFLQAPVAARQIRRQQPGLPRKANNTPSASTLGDNTLGTNYVDFLLGLKGQIT